MQTNRNIESIMGNPRKAINKLAFPTIFSLLLMFLNNLIDSFWVAGINADALAALGFISPLYLVIIGLGTGIGAGTNSLISRYLGAQRIDDANNAIIHSIILTIIVSIIILIVGIFFLDDLIILLGASSVGAYCLSYGEIIFLLNIVFLLPNVIASIFRAEGDVGRATNPLILTAILNMILDPILIYVLDLGIFGAGFATVIASFIGLIWMIYWIYIKKDTYFRFNFSNYKAEFGIYKEILLVSLPAGTEEIIFSLVAIILNYLIITTSGVGEVSAFTIAWRFIAMAFLPCMAIGIATITVSGVAYGACNWQNFNETIKYSTLISLTITLVFTVVFFFFAYPICEVFNFTSNNLELVTRSAEILQLLVFYNFMIPFGATAAYVYQGVGSGFKSLSLTILRELILSMGFAYLMGITFNMGIFGVYLGAIVGMNIGSFIGFICIWIFNLNFKKEIHC
ncbi:putative efflux protein, MATE family [Methanobrevibacter gottschalkii]|uniref:Multidrug-efflux transporter n=2 Tax=Methanobacteriaceae TaxID=2159 RepID=A0A1H7H4H1_9EURY|nr:MATE family efflux transporter [Methanobrevibacter gottschalkii]SEK43015.1 putative efflux protein, MATE family [Methanobrevibacter gottschalkii]